nr:immunoglobulin light chain junction region [Macaca mulatta]
EYYCLIWHNNNAWVF